MGCNRDKIAQDLPRPAQTTTQAQANRELAAVAKALAKTLGNDADARQHLKAQALQRLDGDYDVLYQSFVGEHPDFGQHVADAVAAAPEGLTMAGLLSRVPALNLSVPVNIAKWDAATYAPLVIFVPAGFSERTTQRVLAYDQAGREHWLDAKKTPDFPVVVVGPSERVSATVAQTLTATPSKVQQLPSPGGENQPSNILLPEDGGGGSAPLGGGSNPAPLGTSCRTDKQTEYLRSMHMEDVSVYESWFLGAPEVRLQIKGGGGSTGNDL